MVMLRSLKRTATPLPLSQRRRRRPSRVKTPPPPASSPSERLRLALELSDFCLALREARLREERQVSKRWFETLVLGVISTDYFSHGSDTVNIEPLPTSLSTLSFPPSISVNFLTMCRPNPTPAEGRA